MRFTLMVVQWSYSLTWGDLEFELNRAAHHVCIVLAAFLP
jgi:hypothetical protein